MAKFCPTHPSKILKMGPTKKRFRFLHSTGSATRHFITSHDGRFVKLSAGCAVWETQGTICVHAASFNSLDLNLSLTTPVQHYPSSTQGAYGAASVRK